MLESKNAKHFQYVYSVFVVLVHRKKDGVWQLHVIKQQTISVCSILFVVVYRKNGVLHLKAFSVFTGFSM